VIWGTAAPREGIVRVPTNKQRREAARRHLERQLERRIETDAKRKRRNLIITVIASVVVVVVIVVAMVALIHDDKKTPTAAASTTPAASSSAADTASPSASATTTAPPQPATTGPCAYTQTTTAATKDVGIPPDPSPSPTTARVLTITTNKGPLTMSLDAATAPCAVQSVAYLAGKGYYDNTSCFRLVTTGIFVLQCGDPKNDGSGGPGYQFKDESLTTADYSGVGTIAMANAGANTNGSQFFIIYKDSSAGLGKDYTVIGKITSGMPVVQQVVAGGETDVTGPGDGTPKVQLTFTKLSVAPPVTGSGTLVSPAASAPAASTPVPSSTPSG
jgi:peptidyl-prolyl cis-trans isomerase B (cyclophilin B)